MNQQAKLFIGTLLISASSGLYWEATKQFSIALTMSENWPKTIILLVLGIFGITIGLHLINQHYRNITTNA